MKIMKKVGNNRKDLKRFLISLHQKISMIFDSSSRLSFGVHQPKIELEELFVAS